MLKSGERKRLIEERIMIVVVIVIVIWTRRIPIGPVLAVIGVRVIKNETMIKIVGGTGIQSMAVMVGALVGTIASG
jgi:hypothetical protein